MQIENHKEEVPFSYYAAQYKALDPHEVTKRLSFVSWDGQCFSVTLLGRTFSLAWPEYAITAADALPLPPLPTQTFLLRVLLEGKDVASDQSWKTFREMPWGELYIKPYTGRVLTRAAFTFGTRLESLRKAGEKLGGIPVKHGDVGFQFDLIGPYAMQLLVWAGDDEFPPNAQVLYSGNFADGFAPEDRVVAGDILISEIKRGM